MIDGNARKVIEDIYSQDVEIIFEGKEYFINGCSCAFDEKGNVKRARLEVYDMTTEDEDAFIIFSVECKTQDECVQAFESAPIWNGRTFWDAEHEMTQIG